MEVKQIQQFLFVFAGEQIKRHFVAQTLSRLTVHMIEDKGDILCRELYKAGAFGNDLSQLYVALLNVRLLPGCLGIAEEQTAAQTILCGMLQTDGILELDAVVRQDDREQLAKYRQAQMLRQMVEYIQYAALRGIFQ